jgi:peptide deformylase
MGLLKILYYPNPMLKQVAEPVAVFDQELKNLVSDMFDTMYTYGGVGLAAPQIGKSIRLVVVDSSHGAPKREVYINPVIEELSEETETIKEGCLSFPGIFESAKFAKRIKITYQDVDGNQKTEEIEGLSATVIQHEVDHLDGKLMIDKMSNKKRIAVKTKALRGWR